jgi:uncharacterized protein YndB with AHSA1/START domain
MSEPFRVEVTIAAPVDEVWRALREPALIRHWHGWEYEENGGLDAEIEQIFLRDFTESAAEHTLILGDGDTFTLHQAGDGRTLVRMVRAPKGSNPEWDDYYEDVNEGWTTFMHQLRFALERHPGMARRTIFLDGTGDPFAALGLDRTATGRYTAELAGEPVSGEVWFTSANQAGFTVDSWGNGLLIVGTAPVSPARPHGGAMAVLTTYGQDDAAYQALRDRWTAWWQSTLPKAEVSA